MAKLKAEYKYFHVGSIYYRLKTFPRHSPEARVIDCNDRCLMVFSIDCTVSAIVNVTPVILGRIEAHGNRWFFDPAAMVDSTFMDYCRELIDEQVYIAIGYLSGQIVIKRTEPMLLLPAPVVIPPSLIDEPPKDDDFPRPPKVIFLGPPKYQPKVDCRAIRRVSRALSPHRISI